MNDQTSSREADLIEQLRRSYVSRGYKFIAQPRGSDSPVFLENFVPDAIALSNNDKVVLEIKSATSSKSKSDLVKFLAQEVPKHVGWRFELVIESEADLNSDRSADLTFAMIDVEIVKVLRLFKEKDFKLSIVLGWAILEALCRRLIFDEENFAPSRYKPRSVVEALVSNGFVDDEDGARLLEISQIRNRLVHGFMQVSVESEDVYFLVSTLQKLKESSSE
jgi:REase_AHJR-like/Protein of unknown function DUF86